MLDVIRDGRPLLDWKARLEEYLTKKEDQGDTELHVKHLRGYLTPWVDWAKERGVRPSSQRIREYLEFKEYLRSTYNKVGEHIVDFVNHFANDAERV